MKKLQQAVWATAESNLLSPIIGVQPIKMQNSDGTAQPLVLDDSTQNNFGADIVRFAPGTGVRLHTHVGAHILLVTAGTGTLIYRTTGQGDGITDERHPMFPGMIYLVPSNVPHAIEATTQLVLIAIGNDHKPANSLERLRIVGKANFDFIKEHEGLLVVRGDLVFGGLKSIILTDLLLSGEVTQEEVVYCADPYGHSQLALAVAAYKSGKKATFFTTCLDSTPQQEQAVSLGNTTFHVVKDLTHQSELPSVARKYALENNAYYMPIGYDFEPFNSRLVKFAQSLASPNEVWVPAGSGTTFRALRKAWPDAKIYVVNLGMMPTVNLDGADGIFKVPERHKEVARDLPPYPSNPWYDSKCWQFIQKHANPGALIWNIA